MNNVNLRVTVNVAYFDTFVCFLIKWTANFECMCYFITLMNLYPCQVVAHEPKSKFHTQPGQRSTWCMPPPPPPTYNSYLKCIFTKIRSGWNIINAIDTWGVAVLWVAFVQCVLGFKFNWRSVCTEWEFSWGYPDFKYKRWNVAINRQQALPYFVQ
jgi:hypothetical protein